MNIGTTIRHEFWTGRGARDTEPARSSSRSNNDGPFVQLLLHGRRADAAKPLSNPGDHATPTRRESAADTPAAEPPETRSTSSAESDAASNAAPESRSDSKAADDGGDVDKDRNARETASSTTSSAGTQPATDHATQTSPTETGHTAPATDEGAQDKTGQVDLAPASGGHGPDAETVGVADPSQPAVVPSGSAATVTNDIPPNMDQLKTANLQSKRQPDRPAAASMPDANTDRVASKRAKSHAKKRSNDLTMQRDAAMAKERGTPDTHPSASRSVIDLPAPNTTLGTGVQTHGGGPDNLTTAPPQATGQQAMNATSSGGRAALSEQLFAQHAARTEGPPSVGQADQVRLVQRVARALRVAPRHGGTLRLRLRPPELGALRLEVTMDKGHLSARVEADNTNARHLLLEALPQLRDRLAQQGIRIEQFHVDVGHQGTGQTPDQPHDRLPRPTASSPPARPTAAASGPDSGIQTVTPIVLSPGELNVII